MVGVRLIFLFAIMTSLAGAPVNAQIQISELKWDYQFGEHIELHALLETDRPVESAFCFIQEKGGTDTIIVPATIQSSVDGKYPLNCFIDPSEYSLRTFTTVQYRFDVRTSKGELNSSPMDSFEYADNRFGWRQLEESPFRLYWYEGGLAFAQKTLDIAQEGLKKAQSIVISGEPELVRIYVYANAADLQETISRSGQELVAGHTDPDLGVIVVSLPTGPEQQLLTEQRLPHELMHLLLNQFADANYGNLPTWLNEGMASAAELFPNSDYEFLLDSAYQSNQLLTIRSLCKAFPINAAGALLAYAQSSSFVSYLNNTYGKNRMQFLVSQYANGLDCDQGLVSALGSDLTELEKAWRSARFGEDVVREAIDKLVPWIILLAAMLLAPLILGFLLLRKKSKVGKNASVDLGGRE